MLVGAPQGSLMPLLPLVPPAGAAPAPAPQGSPPDLTPAEGGEEEPANTRGEPRDGGTPTPSMPPQGSGMVELEMMGPIPPQGSPPPAPAPPAAPAPPRGLQGSRLAAVLCGGLGLTTPAPGPPKLRSTRSLRALPPLFFGSYNKLSSLSPFKAPDHLF